MGAFVVKLAQGKISKCNNNFYLLSYIFIIHMALVLFGSKVKLPSKSELLFQTHENFEHPEVHVLVWYVSRIMTWVEIKQNDLLRFQCLSLNYKYNKCIWYKNQYEKS